MNELQDCILGDLVEFQRGYDLPKDSFVKGEYPVQSSNGILGYHNEYKVKAPGITIGRSGTVGIPHLITKNFFPHNTALYVKDFKGNNVHYIYYLLKNLKLNEYKTGSGVPTMNRNHLHPLKIKAFTDSKYQKSIAAVLSALDKKIALNKQINARLEEMAKTLYDYWFVQFDFPDANGKPYKSSGGEMVFDETLKREIPKGWEVKSLGEIATLKAGGDKPELISRFQTQEYKFPIYSNGLNDNALYGYCKKAIITEPSITISARGTIGFTKIRNHSFTPIIRLISVTPKNSQFIKFLELFLSQTSFENAGSVQKQLTIPQIENIKILTPNIKLINKFSDITTLSVGLIESNEKQNHQLTQLRDFLLPMLMNGQVSVVE
ncbi:restriction endonuclease subunit S [Neisseria sp. 27098_8_139]|uniref:restriction endonuclease subunit S n=1 Tax=Neisseria sp. 27098_8_139 TaxID=3003681 RepID=UPI00352F14C9